ncbi:winged helix DNA-binding domain-containing protein [Streptomyces sp. NBC_00091]|uniref:winged helix DNA-binding domain-containing protein n=1 Tax=Streptomyces sp. NBC_00091 TaxID=2975648 RepID=UPI0022591E89|nr:winged helix DNA-binding domain-containing protein [Streptomyces sp. NBC_00091]MCX5381468.1 winged helix DNA-binding domain-containing protein [Streptomyces sp. NBC_00091]
MTTALPRITAAQRRARLARLQLLAPSARVHTAHEVAGALIGLHATDPATVFLAAAARMSGPTVDAIDQALYQRAADGPAMERVRCMRRTMFVVPARLAPAVRSATVQNTDRLRADSMDKLCQALGWDHRRYTAAEQDTLAAMAARGEATAAQLAADVPALREQLIIFPGKAYESRQRVSATVLGVLAAEGRIRRSRPAGSWTSAQFRWAPAQPLPAVPATEARTTLARHYLAAFGPATADDVKWWTGWNLRDTRKAIAATGAHAVELDEGTGYLLPEDLEPLTPCEPGAALLPSLDPTPMGWRHRHWYLDPAHTAALFDRNGNIGPTIWWNGRIIGAWAQNPDGHINHHLLTDPGTLARTAVNDEIDRLTTFLATTRVTPCYRTPLERQLAQETPS